MTMRPTIPALGPLALLLAAGACSLDSDSMGRMPTLGGSTGNASTGAQDETATAAELTGEPLPEGFSYSSDNNDWWLTRDELSSLLT